MKYVNNRETEDREGASILGTFYMCVQYFDKPKCTLRNKFY